MITKLDQSWRPKNQIQPATVVVEFIRGVYIYNPQRSTCCVFLPVFTWFHNNFVLSSKSLIFEDGLFMYIYTPTKHNLVVHP